MHKILISACFIGENVRYNAVIKPLHHPILSAWLAEGRLISVCPEVTGGLATPRPAAEFSQNQQKVLTKTGEDVTDAFLRGAKTALSLCKKHQIKLALLKESSPSCGSHNIYDGSFSHKKIKGKGITCQLLEEHDIEVFSENELSQLIEKIERLEKKEK